MKRVLTALGVALAIALSPRGALADEPRPTGAEGQAKAIFLDGLALFRAGDFGRALDAFQRSGDIAPSATNTVNIAICLAKLGRDVESLTTFEAALRRFGARLRSEERAKVEAWIGQLRPRVGSLQLSSDVAGELFVDGRGQGTLPFSAPLHVTPGSHAIRVVKEGYASFERNVDIPAGAVVILEATLTAARDRVRDHAIVPLPRSSPPHHRPAVEGLSRGWFIEAFGGPVVGPSFGSDVERSVQSACGDRCPALRGLVLGLRVGVSLTRVVAFELGGGYLDLSSAFRRSVDDQFPISAPPGEVAITYRLDPDELVLQGGFATAGGSARFPLGSHIGIVARTSLGVLFARADNPGMATVPAASGPAVPVGIESSAPRGSTSVLFCSEIGVQASLGHFRGGVSLGLDIVAPAAPLSFGARRLQVSRPCDAMSLATCAPTRSLTAARADAFTLWAPQITAAYVF